MKFWVKVGERTIEVDVRHSESRTIALVDGREIEVLLEQGGPGIYTLLADGEPCDLAAMARPRGYSLVLRGVPFDVQVEDEHQRRLSSARALKPGAEGKVTLYAPMPGLVVRVDVSEGEEVARGKHLVVLEAMKMENDIVAPRAARVEKVLVSRGRKVEQGEALIVLE